MINYTSFYLGILLGNTYGLIESYKTNSNEDQEIFAQLKSNLENMYLFETYWVAYFRYNGLFIDKLRRLIYFNFTFKKKLKLIKSKYPLLDFISTN
jgi:hypothetical protein